MGQCSCFWLYDVNSFNMKQSTFNRTCGIKNAIWPEKTGILNFIKEWIRMLDDEKKERNMSRLF